MNFPDIKYILLLLFSTSTLSAQSPISVKSLNDFSFDLFNSITARENNVFFSPISTYIALSMAYEGADGETKSDFEHVLNITDSSGYISSLKLAEKISTFKDSSNYLSLSNSLWIQKDFPVMPEYQISVTERFSSDVFAFDNHYPETVASEINNWISENTNKRINNIINPNEINQLTVLFLANAIYFTGKWASEFDENLTKLEAFYTIDNIKNEIDFLHKRQFMNYYENSKYQFVSIPYEGGDKSFCILLPKKRSGILRLEKGLQHAQIAMILSNMSSREVILSFPKFKMETEYSFKQDLMTLGLAKAFSTEADFSRLSKMNGLAIGDVKHKTFLSIDEKKTEAAAATIIEMQLVSSVQIVSKKKPITFKADHPFIFFIIDNETKGILFMGRYLENS